MAVKRYNEQEEDITPEELEFLDDIISDEDFLWDWNIKSYDPLVNWTISERIKRSESLDLLYEDKYMAI